MPIFNLPETLEFKGSIYQPFPHLTQRRLCSTDLVRQSLYQKATCETTYRESTLAPISQSASVFEFDERLHSFKHRMRK